MAREDEYIAAERPHERADLIISGLTDTTLSNPLQATDGIRVEVPVRALLPRRRDGRRGRYLGDLGSDRLVASRVSSERAGVGVQGGLATKVSVEDA